MNTPKLLDAGTGARLLERGLDPRGNPAEDPRIADAIAALHQADKDAGAEAITSATFSMTEESALKKSVTIARKVAGESLLLASLGPFGDYKRRAQVCLEAGADVIALETFLDQSELLAALRDLSQLPVWASRALLPDTSPQTVDDAFCQLTDAGARRVGIQCTATPETLRPFLEVLSTHQAFARPGFVQRCAKSAARFAQVFLEARNAGVLFGGCCGVQACDLHTASSNRRIELPSTPRA